jgi:carboxymethylenebutenolidase
VIEETLEIRTPDGISRTSVFRPDNGEKLPGAIHLTDIGGIRESQYQKARELANAGYVVFIPNIFYRVGEPPVLPRAGEVDDARRMERVSELRASLPADAMEADMAAYIDALVASGYASDAPIGVVGYCFSGKMALHAAAVRPENVGAGASFHGGYLVTKEPTSPHLLLPRIRARLYFGHAVEDPSMPREAIEELDRALATWGGRYESEVYAGAHHSWTEPDSPVYNAAQAERAFQKLLDWFAVDPGLKGR